MLTNLLSFADKSEIFIDHNFIVLLPSELKLYLSKKLILK